MANWPHPIPILLADDRQEDRMLTSDALKESRVLNDLRFVGDGEELIEYLRHTGRSLSHGGIRAPNLEALGLGNVRTNFGHLLSVDEETWKGDHLTFRVRSLGQSAAGTIEVFEEQVRLEVTLPWLLAKLTERLVPAIRKEGTLLLEKK